MSRVLVAALAGAALSITTVPGVGQAQESADARFSITTVAEGLAFPWSMAFLPNGDILVTEKPGRLRLVRDGALVEEPVSGLPDDIFYGGQGGLLDVALHPQFASNRLVYLTYSAGAADANATTVARGRLDGASLSGVETVFAARPLKSSPIHFGGRLAFLPDGTFALTIGDGFVWREDAQRLDTHIGKIVRLNDDGSIPPDNPWVDEEGALGEIWTIGHRNPQGLAVDPATGRLWETEHGPWGGDELNLIEGGKNYGWPVITWGRDYNGARISPFREYPGMEQPKVDWTPVIAASGLAVYRGALFDDWNGDILAGGLGGLASSGYVVRVEVDASGQAREAERLFADLGARIRDVRVGPDGAIYLLTDDAENGRLLRVTPR